MNILERLALTASYVTCLPVYKVDLEVTDELLAGLSKYLPAVGLLIGVCLCLSDQALGTINAPHLVRGAVLTVLWFVFTSGLHLDGLMDTADGIFSHQRPERMLEIMQDPRVGNFGVIVGILLLLTKFACLSSIANLCLPIFLIPAWARLAEVYAIGNFKYLKDQGKGKIWHDTTNYPKDFFKAALCPALCTIAVFLKVGWIVVAVAAATLAGGMLCARWLNQKLSGHTGDTYGATVEFAEVAGIVAAALLSM